MPSITIYRDWDVGGELTDVDSVNLTAITASDSSTPVSSLPAVFTKYDTGRYSFTFTATIGVIYTATTTVVWTDVSGQTITQVFTKTYMVPGSDIPVNGVYHARSDIESCFGRDNVRIWSSLGPSDTPMDAANRIQGIINWTESVVNSYLRRSRYVIPFTGVIPLEIVEVCAHLSGAKLAEPRTTSDFSDEGQPMKTFVSLKRRDALATLKNILANKIRLDAPDKANVSEAMSIVRTDDLHIRPIRDREISLDELSSIVLGNDIRQCSVFNDT